MNREEAITVELRGDGAHLRWSGYARYQRHEIVVKHDGGNLNPEALLRVRAFSLAFIENPVDPKKSQKKWEKKLASSEWPPEDEVMKHCLEILQTAVHGEYEQTVRMAVIGLQSGVKRALTFFTSEEVEQLVREAMASDVMES